MTCIFVAVLSLVLAAAESSPTADALFSLVANVDEDAWIKSNPTHKPDVK
jgi:hypothetical protein